LEFVGLGGYDGCFMRCDFWNWVDMVEKFDSFGDSLGVCGADVTLVASVKF
jgi:hypothetical protein